ncbi:MAG: hypothetical protein DMG58_00910 [Acidobacteria bacterium]|nr:MAG: hypothetical protein DMG58_00910 [Acidobacteriota bacterium]
MCASRAVAVPITVGAKEPAILLPGDWQSWDDWKLRAVLAHELAHIRRGDWLVTVATSVNRCIFWFHPLAWWLERRLSALAEDACDEAALLSTGDAPRYASTILEFAAALQASGGRLAQPGVAMARSSKVSRRIHRILETRQLAPGILRKSAWAAVLACALPLVYSAAALQVTSRAAERPPDPGLAQLLTEGSKLSAAEAQDLEQQLVRDPEDIAARAKLISYYSWHAVSHPRLEHIFWFIERHPESEITSYFGFPHLASQLDHDRAKALWLQQADAHHDDARVLANAARVVGESDQFAQRDLLKRARDVDPSNPEWAKRLADVFARAISMSFWAPVVPPVDPGFAEAAKAELETSTDAVLVGTVGEFLTGGPPGGGPPRPAQIDYAEHLLNRLNLSTRPIWSGPRLLPGFVQRARIHRRHPRRVAFGASASERPSSNLTCSARLIPSIQPSPGKPVSRVLCASTSSLRKTAMSAASHSLTATPCWYPPRRRPSSSGSTGLRC